MLRVRLRGYHALDAAEQAIGQLRPGARGLAVFARDGAVRLSGTLPHPPLEEIARYAPLPHVVPWLAQRPRHLPHVRVSASHGGGRLLAVSAAAGTPRTTEVDGQSWPVHKVSAGGWAERRLQRAAEETWACLDDFRVRMTGTDPRSRRATEGLGDTLTALRDGLASVTVA